MKQIALIPSLFLLFILFFSSCEDDRYADWKILNDDWLEAHKSDSGFVQSESKSGLYYQVIHQGYMRKPGAYSNIEVKYEGKLITGTVFDKTDDDETLKTNMASVIAGWTEGVAKMNVGGRYKFYIPAELAYGEDGSGSIPPHSVLIFDITLVASDDQLD